MSTVQTHYTPAEVGERGQALYDRNLRDQMQKTHFGQYLVINIATGEYEIGVDHLDTAKRARAKYPDASLYGMRVGYKAVVSFGPTLRPDVSEQPTDSRLYTLEEIEGFMEADRLSPELIAKCHPD